MALSIESQFSKSTNTFINVNIILKSIKKIFQKSAKSRGKLKPQRENQKKNQNSKSSKVSFHESKKPKLKSNKILKSTV